MLKKFDLTFLLLVVLALAGALVVYTSTHYGIGLSPDSVKYIQAARNLLAGQGLVVWSAEGGYSPLTQFPPLYPFLLAMLGGLGLNLLVAAKLLNTILFAANIFSVGFILCSCAPNRSWFWLLASVLIACSAVMLEIHSMAWTEALFIFFGLWGMYLLSRHLGSPRSTILFIAALAVALAWLSRYIGVALMLSGVIAILVLGRIPFRLRLCEAALFAAISTLPLFLWLLRSLLAGASGIERNPAYHPITLAHLKSAALTFASWLAPKLLPIGLRLVILAAVILLTSVLFLQIWKRKYAGIAIRPVAVPLIFMLVYVFVLGFSISFVDAHTPLDNRILSPFYVAGFIVAYYFLEKLFSQTGTRDVGRGAAIAILGIVSGFYLLTGVSRVTQTYREGLGYASPVWQQSRLMAAIRELPEAVPIFTNDVDSIYLFTGRHALRLPLVYDPESLLPNPAYASQMLHMGEKVARENGAVVFIYTIGRRMFLPSEAEIEAVLPLRVLAREVDGVIYISAESGNP